MPELLKNKIEPRIEVLNAVDGPVKVYLYGVIRKKTWWDDGDDDFISADRVQKLLNDLDGKDLVIHMNSNGGDVFESITISNLIRDYEGNVDLFIDGMAASGASIVATAADKVIMYTNSQQMIHKAWTFASGNANDLRKVSDDLDKIDTSVKASYEKRFVGEKDELEALIKNETYLTAEECLAFGLCDEIVDLEDEEEEMPKDNIKENLFNKYKGNIQNKTPKKKVTNEGNNENDDNSLFKNFRR